MILPGTGVPETGELGTGLDAIAFLPSGFDCGTEPILDDFEGKVASSRLPRTGTMKNGNEQLGTRFESVRSGVADECRLERDHLLHTKGLEVILIGGVSIRNSVISDPSRWKRSGRRRLSASRRNGRDAKGAALRANW